MEPGKLFGGRRSSVFLVAWNVKNEMRSETENFRNFTDLLIFLPDALAPLAEHPADQLSVLSGIHLGVLRRLLELLYAATH